MFGYISDVQMPPTINPDLVIRRFYVEEMALALFRDRLKNFP